MAKVKIYPPKVVNTIVSHRPGVKAEIAKEAQIAKARAEARLAQHRDTGAAQVVVTRDHIDYLVELVDKAAVSIEFGHFVKGKYETDEPKFVPGLYIISEATGLL